ncbi:MAG: hypothetical protein ACFB10_20985 [Salibacteraceae bacterium]
MKSIFRPSNVLLALLAVSLLVSCARVKNYPEKIVDEWTDCDGENPEQEDRYRFNSDGTFHFQYQQDQVQKEVKGTYWIEKRNIYLTVTETYQGGRQVWKPAEAPLEASSNETDDGTKGGTTDTTEPTQEPVENFAPKWTDGPVKITWMNRFDMCLGFEHHNDDDMLLHRN